jgi:microcin C transport system substrate-binding protein
VFGHPPNLPKYLGVGVPDLWWSVVKSSATGEQAK